MHWIYRSNGINIKFVKNGAIKFVFAFFCVRNTIITKYDYLNKMLAEVPGVALGFFEQTKIKVFCSFRLANYIAKVICKES